MNKYIKLLFSIILAFSTGGVVQDVYCTDTKQVIQAKTKSKSEGKQPKVTIIIPVYNVEPYLRQCLDSVVNQTLKEIEIICIDDCSTDGSSEILQEYAAKDSRINIIKQETNQGQGVGRNMGIDAATGEYLIFLDPDDWLELTTCEDTYRQIKTNNNDIVFFGVTIYDQKTGKMDVNKSRLAPFIGLTDQKQIKLSEMDKPFIMSQECWFKIYRTKFLQDNNIKFYPTRASEELQFVPVTYLLADTVSVLNKPLYYYRINRPGSAATEWHNEFEKFNEVFDLREKARNLIDSNSEYNWMQMHFIKYYVITALCHYHKFLRGNPAHKKYAYEKVRDLFLELDRKYPIDQYELPEKHYRFFKHVVKYGYYQSKIVRFFNKLFGMRIKMGSPY